MTLNDKCHDVMGLEIFAIVRFTLCTRFFFLCCLFEILDLPLQRSMEISNQSQDEFRAFLSSFLEGNIKRISFVSQNHCQADWTSLEEFKLVYTVDSFIKI